MPKFHTIDLLRFVEQTGQTYTRDFAKIGMGSGNVRGYMASHIKAGRVLVQMSNQGYHYVITDKGRAYLADPKSETLKKHHLPSPAQVFMQHAEPSPSPIAPVRRLTDDIPDSLEQAIDNLNKAIIARITSVVEGHISHMMDAVVTKQITATVNKLTAGITAQTSEPPKKPEPPKEAKRKVLIVGLLDAQAQIIENEFQDGLDLRFAGSNANSGWIKSVATHSDVVFVMADFVSHATIKLIESVGTKPKIIKGGMTHIKDALTTYFVEG